MNKLTTFLIIAAGLLFSCNSSQTETNEQTSDTEDSTQIIQTEETTYKIKDNEVTETENSNDTPNTLRQDKENEQTIFWTDFYKQFKKTPQTFSINCNKDTLLSCLEGTTIKIRSNSFVSEKTGNLISGTVKITVTEYYKLSDIMLANLSTTSNNALLETGGMLHIAAISNNENCKIKDGQKIEIGFPAKAKKGDMQLFTGSWNNEKMNWQVRANSMDLNKVYTEKDVYSQFFKDNEKTIQQHLNNKINYPQKALDSGIGGTVLIRFTVDREGNVKDAYVFEGTDPELDKEALNVISKSPKLKPAQINGEYVNVSFTIPVQFVFYKRHDEDTTTRVRSTTIGTTKSADIKQSFEKIYNDSTINKAYSSEITSYLFSTSELGWINCDRFVNEKEKKVDLLVKLDEKAESDVKIVFHRIKSVMSSSPNYVKHIFTDIPKGEKITIVAIKNINNKPYLAIKETVISGQTETKFIFQPVTMETLQSEMKKFDELH